MTTGAVVLLALVVALGVATLARWISFHRLGYRFIRSSRDQWVYEELSSAHRLRRLVFDGEMLVRAPHTLWIPDAASWDREMPEWAHGRRSEIVLRIKERAGNVVALVETKATSLSG